MEPDDITKKAYFVGIAGVGMSATAIILKELGWQVSGSDDGCYPPISDALEQHEIPVHKNYNAKNLPEDIDLVVGGGSAKLKAGLNPEIKRAEELGLNIKTFPEVVGELSKDKHNILVTGSYGKSTVTALISWCLENSGREPSYFIGALPIGMESHGHIGEGEHFVIEGDEYPTSSVDHRAKFLHFTPTDIVLVSGEHDHVNIFPTTKDYLKPYEDLLKIPSEGIVVACLDNPNVKEIIDPHKGRVITYGLNENNNPDWLGENIKRGTTTKFDLFHKGERISELETQLLGDHNIQNIVGAAALILEKKMLSVGELAASLKKFQGIKRRLENVSDTSSVLVYEGFGSSHDKATSAIDAIRAHFPGRRLVVVFEPHTFSWRNRDKLYWYDDVFKGADKVLIYHPPSIGVESHEQVTHQEIVERVREAGVTVRGISTPAEGEEELRNTLKKEDVVLILTSGDMDGLVSRIPKLAEELFPEK